MGFELVYDVERGVHSKLMIRDPEWRPPKPLWLGVRAAVRRSRRPDDGPKPTNQGEPAELLQDAPDMIRRVSGLR